LRNEITHNKSEWSSDIADKKLLKSLQHLGHPKPTFMPDNQPFWPHCCLSAGCALWASATAEMFINAFFERLEIQSPLV